MYEFVPNIILQAAIMSFVFAVVLFGIFRKKNRQPVDLQEALEFAQSKAKARKDGTTDVKLSDVAGLDVVKHQFEEIVMFLKDPGAFSGSGVRAPKGVLLEGPPGTGKTLIAKAIAGEADVGFYQMSGSEFVEAIVGVGAARVRDLFKRARAYKDPILIFVDEIDALALARASGTEQANEEREQVCMAGDRPCGHVRCCWCAEDTRPCGQSALWNSARRRGFGSARCRRCACARCFGFWGDSSRVDACLLCCADAEPAADGDRRIPADVGRRVHGGDEPRRAARPRADARRPV